MKFKFLPNLGSEVKLSFKLMKGAALYSYSNSSLNLFKFIMSQEMAACCDLEVYE